MLVFPNAKINIGLNVVEKRADGYHNIETVFYPVYGLYDALEAVSADEVSLNVSGFGISGDDGDNLVMKAYRLLNTADARGEYPIFGMLSLAIFEIPTGVRAWIEDVVVDEAARGQGAGLKLVEAALEQAKKVGARTVDLTSRPSREAANRLYRRAGFEQRETNVYRVPLD